MATTLEDLMREHPSIGEIPPEALAEAGFTRLEDPNTGRVRVHQTEDFQEKRTKAAMTLRKNRDYLHTTDRESLYALLRGEAMVSDKDFARIWGRANALRDSGVPPIFRREMEGVSQFEIVELKDGEPVPKVYKGFPALDLILQLGAGTYFMKRQQRGRQRKKTSLGAGIEGASVGDIIKFRQYAFDGDRLNPLIHRLLHYVKDEKFDIGSENRSAIDVVDAVALRHLEESLKDFDVEPVERQPYDGDLSVIRRPDWFLYFTPEDRERIVTEYQAAISDKESGFAPTTKQNRATYRLMTSLYPGQLDWEDPLEAMTKARFAEATESGDYRHVPSLIWTDEAYAAERDRLFQHVQESLVERVAEDPKYALRQLVDITHDLKVSRLLLYDEEVALAIDGLRFIGAQRMTDAQYQEFLKDKNKSSFRAGYQGEIRGQPSKLRSYVRERINRLDD